MKAELEGAVGGAMGGASADLSYLSSDEDAEKCPICLNSFHEQPVATPESCKHYFCLDCILEWSKVGVEACVLELFFSTLIWRTRFRYLAAQRDPVVELGVLCGGKT